jgi:hypothetical protein
VFTDFAQDAMDVKVTDDRFKKLLARALPDRPKTGQVIESIIEGRKTSITIPDDHRTTGWGAFNATTEYFDHLRPTAGKGESRFINVMTGDASRARNRLGAMLQAIS